MASFSFPADRYAYARLPGGQVGMGQVAAAGQGVGMPGAQQPLAFLKAAAVRTDRLVPPSRLVVCGGKLVARGQRLGVTGAENSVDVVDHPLPVADRRVGESRVVQAAAGPEEHRRAFRRQQQVPVQRCRLAVLSRSAWASMGCASCAGQVWNSASAAAWAACLSTAAGSIPRTVAWTSGCTRTVRSALAGSMVTRPRRARL